MEIDQGKEEDFSQTSDLFLYELWFIGLHELRLLVWLESQNTR
jgi:hypothetical protein